MKAGFPVLFIRYSDISLTCSVFLNEIWHVWKIDCWYALFSQCPNMNKDRNCIVWRKYDPQVYFSVHSPLFCTFSAKQNKVSIIVINYFDLLQNPSVVFHGAFFCLLLERFFTWFPGSYILVFLWPHWLILSSALIYLISACGTRVTFSFYISSHFIGL